jgi:hypothetical protein
LAPKTLIANIGICLAGAYLVVANQTIGRAVARTTDLKIFRLRPDTEEDRRRWAESHSLATGVVGMVMMGYALWNLLGG